MNYQNKYIKYKKKYLQLKGGSEIGQVKTITYIDGVYKGQINGTGTMTYTNGDVYNGNWKDHKKHGTGIMNYNNYDVYDGNWKHDTKDGTGIMNYANGDVYNGKWKRDIKNGTGTMTYADNVVYIGNWENDKRHDRGKIIFRNGDYIDGIWEDDNPLNGLIFSPKNNIIGYINNGNSYEGQLNNHKKTGIGIMNYANGDVYDGNWKNDNKHGKGIMNYANGDVYDGNWGKNKKHGKGIMNYANGDVYDGNWGKNKKQGRGIMIYANNSYFDGIWVNDEPNRGFIIFSDKSFREIKDGKQINNKSEDIKSVPIITQIKSDCWAHAVSRNFVRTLQILCVIKSEFVQQFYDLFYTILTEYKTCEEGNQSIDAMFYLLDYLKTNYEEQIFQITYDNKVCTNLYCTNTGIILDIDINYKKKIIKDLKNFFDNDILFIGNYTYIVNPEGNNKPTKGIKTMLEYRLQPIVTININNYLDEQTNMRTLNLPSVEQKINFDNKCITYDSYSHAINLRKWEKNYIEFKNSWGTNISNEGNFSVTDLKYLICFDDNKIYNNIKFISLMFNFNKLSEPYKTYVFNKYNRYQPIFNTKVIIKKDYNYEGSYDKYGLFEGQGKLRYSGKELYNGNWKNGNMHGHGIMTFNNGDIYDGEWENDKREGHGIMSYNNGKIYDGEWKDNKKHGKEGILKLQNGDILFNGEWLYDKPVI
jgi:hypothetical protein